MTLETPEVASCSPESSLDLSGAKHSFYEEALQRWKHANLYKHILYVYMDAESGGKGHYLGIRSVLVSICSPFVGRGVLINHVMQIQAPIFFETVDLLIQCTVMRKYFCTNPYIHP